MKEKIYMTSMIEELNYTTLNNLTQVIFHNSSSTHFFFLLPPHLFLSRFFYPILPLSLMFIVTQSSHSALWFTWSILE